MQNTYGYALFTLQTGGKPIAAFELIFNTLTASITKNIDNIEKEHGSTLRKNLEIALSDTTILMVYSLIEGFFFEEYRYYFSNKTPKSLEESFDKLYKHFKLDNKELLKDINHIKHLREVRNAITHRNGCLRENEKQNILKNFKGEISIKHGYPLASLSFLKEIITIANKAISVYSQLVLDKHCSREI